MKRLADFDFGGLLARVASFASRRARWVVAAGLVIAAIAAVAALRLEPSAATSTLVDKNDPAYKATQGFHREFGDDAIVVLAKGRKGEPHALGAMVLTEDLGKLLRLEGCLSGKVPRKAKAGDGRLRRAGPDQADQGRLRAGHVHQRGRRPDLRSVPGRGKSPARPGRQGRHGRAQGRRGKRLLARAAGSLRRAGTPARLLELRPRRGQAGAQVRADERAGAQQPRLRAAAGVRSRARPGRAQVALQLRLPQLERRADPGPAETGPQRRRATPHDRAGARGDRGPGLPAQVRQLPRLRRPGDHAGRRVEPRRPAARARRRSRSC